MVFGHINFTAKNFKSKYYFKKTVQYFFTFLFLFLTFLGFIKEYVSLISVNILLRIFHYKKLACKYKDAKLR